MADRVAVFNQGRIEQLGTPRERLRAAGAPRSSRASSAAPNIVDAATARAGSAAARRPSRCGRSTSLALAAAAAEVAVEGTVVDGCSTTAPAAAGRCSSTAASVLVVEPRQRRRRPSGPRAGARGAARLAARRCSRCADGTVTARRRRAVRSRRLSTWLWRHGHWLTCCCCCCRRCCGSAWSIWARCWRCWRRASSRSTSSPGQIVHELTLATYAAAADAARQPRHHPAHAVRWRPR